MLVLSFWMYAVVSCVNWNMHYISTKFSFVFCEKAFLKAQKGRVELAFNLQSKKPEDQAVVTPSTEENGSTSKEQDGKSTTEEPEGMSIENAAMNTSEF